MIYSSTNALITKHLPISKYRKSAFSLAEVLLSLAIIGVIAVVVIPSMQQSTQDLQSKVAWKKAYSVIAAANQKIAMDNGGTLKGLNWVQIFYKYNDIFAVQKSCYNVAGCMHQYEQVKIYDGSPAGYGNDDIFRMSSNTSFVLNDGTLLGYGWSGDCNSLIYGPDKACYIIFQDVNGYKNPNTIGKDIFGVFAMADGSILPLKDYKGTDASKFARGYSKSAELLISP